MASWTEPRAHLAPGGTDSLWLIGFLPYPAGRWFIFLPQVSILSLQGQMGEQQSLASGTSISPREEPHPADSRGTSSRVRDSPGLQEGKVPGPDLSQTLVLPPLRC